MNHMFPQSHAMKSLLQFGDKYEFCGTVKRLSEVFERLRGNGRNGNREEIWFGSIFQFTIRVSYPFYFLKIVALPYTNYYSPPLRPFTPPIRKLFFISFLIFIVLFFFFHDTAQLSLAFLGKRMFYHFTKDLYRFHNFHSFTCVTKICGNCRCVFKFWVSFDNSFFFQACNLTVFYWAFCCFIAEVIRITRTMKIKAKFGVFSLPY